MDDTIQIRCPRCKGAFRDKARRVQSGYSRQCPSCEALVFFEESTVDKNILRALLEAKKLRKLLRDEESIRPASRPRVHRRS